MLLRPLAQRTGGYCLSNNNDQNDFSRVKQVVNANGALAFIRESSDGEIQIGSSNSYESIAIDRIAEIDSNSHVNTPADWNSEAIKEAFTLNVNGRDLNSADFSLSYDSAMQNIVVNLESSAQIFEGQTVTLDFDSTKITGEGAPQITDSNGNPLQPSTIVIDNDSSVVDTNPTLEEVKSQWMVLSKKSRIK